MNTPGIKNTSNALAQKTNPQYTHKAKTAGHNTDSGPSNAPSQNASNQKPPFGSGETNSLLPFPFPHKHLPYTINPIEKRRPKPKEDIFDDVATGDFTVGYGDTLSPYT